MKTTLTFSSLIALLFTFSNIYADNGMWAIKCLGVDGHAIHVKAFTQDAKTYDVKGFRNHTMMLYAVTLNHKKYPIKISKNYKTGAFDLNALIQGTKARLRGVVFTGRTIDVRAYRANSDHFDIYCITPEKNKLRLKAISPAGEVFNVKDAKNLPGKKGVEFKLD